MSSLEMGVNLNVNGQLSPGDILPWGVYSTSKKLRISSFSGKTLKELKAFETLVRWIVRLCVLPTVKSLNVIFAGLLMKAEPLNTFPWTT